MLPMQFRLELLLNWVKCFFLCFQNMFEFYFCWHIIYNLLVSLWIWQLPYNYTTSFKLKTNYKSGSGRSNKEISFGYFLISFFLAVGVDVIEFISLTVNRCHSFSSHS